MGSRVPAIAEHRRSPLCSRPGVEDHDREDDQYLADEQSGRVHGRAPVRTAVSGPKPLKSLPGGGIHSTSPTHRGTSPTHFKPYPRGLGHAQPTNSGFGHTLDDEDLPLLFIWNEHADPGRDFDAGQAMATFSISIEVIHSPPDLFGSDAPFHSPPAWRAF